MSNKVSEKLMKGLGVVTKEIIMVNPEHFDRIKPNPANRITSKNKNHIAKLKKSMLEFGYDLNYPIKVDHNFMIQAGHHRFIAAQEAQVPIAITIQTDSSLVDETKKDDIAKKWSTIDFITLYAGKENKHYSELLKIVEAYSHFPIKVIIASVCGKKNQASGDIFEDIRHGKFKMRKEFGRVDVERELDEIENLHYMIPDEHRQSKINMHFALAYLYIKGLDGFDKQSFQKAVSKNRQDLIPQTGGAPSNRKWLLNIYNKGKTTKKIGV